MTLPSYLSTYEHYFVKQDPNGALEYKRILVNWLQVRARVMALRIAWTENPHDPKVTPLAPFHKAELDNPDSVTAEELIELKMENALLSVSFAYFTRPEKELYADDLEDYDRYSKTHPELMTEMRGRLAVIISDCVLGSPDGPRDGQTN